MSILLKMEMFFIRSENKNLICQNVLAAGGKYSDSTAGVKHIVPFHLSRRGESTRKSGLPVPGWRDLLFQKRCLIAIYANLPPHYH